MKKFLLIASIALVFSCAQSVEASPHSTVPSKFDVSAVAAPSLQDVTDCSTATDVTSSATFTVMSTSHNVIVDYTATSMTVETYSDTGGASFVMTLPCLYPAYTSDPDINKWSNWRDNKTVVNKKLQISPPLIT